MSLGRRTLTGIRPTGAYDAQGRWQESTTAGISFEASVQPLSSRELKSLPEGRKADASFRLYTDYALKTVDEKTGKNADRVKIKDRTGAERWYEVVSVEDWGNGIVSHYKAVVSLMEQTADGAA